MIYYIIIASLIIILYIIVIFLLSKKSKKQFEYNINLKKELEKSEEQNEKLNKIQKDLTTAIEKAQIQYKEFQELVSKEKEKLNLVQETKEKMENTITAAFEQFCNTLEYSYKEKEKEYDNLTENLSKNYAEKEYNFKESIDKIKQELNRITESKAAAMEALAKEEEIKNNKKLYCPQINENEIKDIKILKDIEYKLSNPRTLRMLIWSTYYQKPINQVCINILGSSTAKVSGIYKITNQINGLVYIGQAVDLATRIKNHAKYGLGIDTPQNNKLYKAMEEYGLENFSFEILEKCNSSELDIKEKFYISLYNSKNFGYNTQAGNGKESILY